MGGDQPACNAGSGAAPTETKEGLSKRPGGYKIQRVGKTHAWELTNRKEAVVKQKGCRFLEGGWEVRRKRGEVKHTGWKVKKRG